MQNTASGTPSPQRPVFLILATLCIVLCIALALTGFLPSVVMGVVQGIGEFLPISSSAHLILIPWFLGWNDGAIGTLTFDVALHLGTLTAVVGYFWRDWISLIRAIPATISWLFQRLRGTAPAPDTASHLLIAIVIGTIPGAITGKLLQDTVEGPFRNPLLLAGTLALMGLALWLVDRRMPQQRGLNQLNWRDALLVGLAQGAAIVPGVSRSGATMTAARGLKLDRTAAARFSFLLSAPITLAAVLLKLPDMLAASRSELPTFIVGVLVSGIVGALSIHFLLGYIRKIGFGIFAFYRFGLAILIILVYLLRQ